MYNFYQNRRSPNSDRNGNSFSESTKLAVWSKAAIDVMDPTGRNYRRDKCGALLAWNAYGNTNLQAGWEIDHIKPIAHGGGDDLSNLQALQWENNRYKSDSYPHWFCKVGR